jgi:formate hydrogenlyase subunit 4
MFPWASSMAEFKSPEMQAKLAQGPTGSLVVRDKGCMNIGRSLGQWFLFCLVISVFVGYLTGLAKGPGASDVFRVATTVAVLGHCFTSVCDSIWKGIAWSTTAKFVFDGVLYALVTGATFAWLWPAAAA